jgi:CspA family cold shock protein
LARKEFHEKRRRGFDDDDFAPPRRSRFGGHGNHPASPPMNFPSAPDRSGVPPVAALVKWFNPEKGFGFVAVEGAGDAFLHAAVLQRAGRDEVAAGATLQVRVGAGQKGQQVTEVVSVDDSTATPARPRSGMGGGGGGGRAPLGPAVPMAGTTKWYDPNKGFGFVSVQGGGKDVFVHVSVLERGGLSTLEPGQRVSMDVAEGRRNPEAVSIRLAD